MMVVDHGWWRVQAVGGGEQGVVGTVEQEAYTVAGERCAGSRGAQRRPWLLKRVGSHPGARL